MSTVHMTRVWGWHKGDLPILGFNSEGNRKASIGRYRPGDWVLLVGTGKEPTKPEHRGRLLGLYKLASIVTFDNVEQGIKDVGIQIPDRQYDEDGNYRWPFGVAITERHEIDGMPLLMDILPYHDNRKAMSEVNQAVPLTAEESVIVLSLPRTRQELPKLPEYIQEQVRAQAMLDGTSKRRGIGPQPSQRSKREFRDVDWSSVGTTYLFKLPAPIGKAPGFKIGFSSDAKRRLKEFNMSPVAVLSGQQMEVVITREFKTAMLAYDFEQMLHNRLESKCIGYECYQCITQKDIESEFNKAYTDFIKQDDGTFDHGPGLV